MKIIKPNILVSLTESPDQEKAGIINFKKT